MLAHGAPQQHRFAIGAHVLHAGRAKPQMLLERGSRSEYKILAYRMESRVAVVLAYQLHYAGAGDNLVVGDPVWNWFGMDRADVVDGLKRLSLQGYFLVQSAAGVTRIERRFKNWEELIRVFAQE